MNITSQVKVFCPVCRHRLSANVVAFLLDGESGFHCECGERVTLVTAVIDALTPQRLRPHAAETFTWHHATLVPDWLSTVQNLDLHVHVGEAVTAREMAVWEVLENNAEYIYLWKVKVKPTSSVHPDVFFDADEEDTFPKNVCSLYLNRYEAPGSTSLFLPAVMLEAVKSEVVSRDELLSTPSFFTV